LIVPLPDLEACGFPHKRMSFDPISVQFGSAHNSDATGDAASSADTGVMFISVVGFIALGHWWFFPSPT
jgi:hypothetical protein